MGSLLEEGFRYGDQGQGSVIRMGYMGKGSALSHQGVLNAQNTGQKLVENPLPPFGLDQVTGGDGGWGREVYPLCRN